MSTEDINLITLRNTALDRFDYCPDTGVVTLKKWVNGYTKDAVGKPVTTSTASGGYYNVRLLGTKFRLHRIIWLMQTGEMPEFIDHKNRVRNDNRWSNLIDTSKRKNSRNTEKFSNNIQEVKLQEGKTYRIRFYIHDKHEHLFTVPNKENAIAVSSLCFYLLNKYPGINKEELKEEILNTYEDIVLS